MLETTGQSRSSHLHRSAHPRVGKVRALLVAALGLADWLMIFAGFWSVNALFQNYGLRGEDATTMLMTMPIFTVASLYARGYAFDAIGSLRITITRLVHSWLITVAVVLLVLFSDKSSAELSRLVFLGSMLAVPVLLLGERIVLFRMLRALLADYLWREVFIDAGVDSPAAVTLHRIDASEVGCTPDINDPISLHNFSGLVADYDRVLVGCPPDQRVAWAMYLQAIGCDGDLLIPELANLPLVGRARHHDMPAVQVSARPLDLSDRVLKRLLDVAITVPLVIAVTPLLVLTAIAIKLDSPGPILFRQQRMGRNNRLFDVLKFRSMRHEASDFSGTRSASRDDDRITRVGRIIRATSIDELPQLLNIIQGEMALVGPRPHALGSRAGEDLFWHVDQRYWLRHSIKPGMTGLAQVRGFRGATDYKHDLSNRLQSDLEYLVDWSVYRDIAILLRTVAVIVHKKAF